MCSHLVVRLHEVTQTLARADHVKKVTGKRLVWRISMISVVNAVVVGDVCEVIVSVGQCQDMDVPSGVWCVTLTDNQ